MKNKTVCIISICLLSTIIIFSIKPNKTRRLGLTMGEIYTVITKISTYLSKKKNYKPQIQHQKIPKTICPRSFSDSIKSKLNVDMDHVFTMGEMRSFMANGKNRDFINSQVVRYDVHDYDTIVQGVIVPEFLDAIFEQTEYYSQYDIGSAVFHFYYPGLRQDFKDKMVEIMDIYTAMANMSTYSTKVPRKLRIHIMFTNLKKNVKSGDVIGIPQNINSGMKFGNVIIIWREEEVIKVFIHEMIHMLKIDLKGISLQEKNAMLSILPVSIESGSPTNPMEAFTEAKARFLYSIYLSNINGTTVEYELKNQYVWTMKQCATILYLNGVKSVSKKFHIKQKTYMYEYYVLCALYLHELVSTMDFGIYTNFMIKKENRLSKSNISKILSTIDTVKFSKHIDDLIADISNKPQKCYSLKMSINFVI